MAMPSTDGDEVHDHVADKEERVETEEVQEETPEGERQVEDVDMVGENDTGLEAASVEETSSIPDLPVDATTEASATPIEEEYVQKDADNNPPETEASTATDSNENADAVNPVKSPPSPASDAVDSTVSVPSEDANALGPADASSTTEPSESNVVADANTTTDTATTPTPVDDSTTPSEVNASHVVSTAPDTPSTSPLKRKRVDSDGKEDTDDTKENVDVGAASDDLTSVIMSRDEMAKKEEDTGLLEFCVITNDGTPDRMVQLMTLKNIFSKQLPKMPKEYIVRLVFDRNHHSMVILKNKKTVVGGICYRPFLANHFGEIAFCAITASEQVKGYGTRLMNHLKEYVKTQGLTHFLTYADNYAIGYFKKQGFSKVVSMARPNWFGYIKDYDGGTLMECQIHHNINYLEITSMVHRQRSMILNEIQKRSKADIVYPGLTAFCDSRLVNIHAVPGVKEAGWSQTLIRSSRTSRDSTTLKQQLQAMWKSLSTHRSAWPFHEPVDVTVVTDYLDFVKHPIDLSAIQKKVDDNVYATKAAFKDDLILMCDNSMVYNSPDTNYYKAAKDLLEFVKKKVVVETQGEGGASSTTAATSTASSKKNLVR